MRKAFTLIELLIVVAIIAILAAIAVPNFLEAQTRAKVSRVKSDMRTVVVSLESYRTDNNSYPIPLVAARGLQEVSELTTPVSYLTSLPLDPFPKAKGFANGNNIQPFAAPIVDQYKYGNLKFIDAVNPNQPSGRSQSWLRMAGAGYAALSQDCVLIFSYGPDEYQNLIEGYASGVFAFDTGAIYDPTNGTVSMGDIARVTGSPKVEMARLLSTGR